ncbi:hypothetical protein J2789_000154 [Variovorax paradoxus]|uniref:zinc ribbon domain-containing protein n=1 Tax=Variovorax atrisoli TaxID=3394203 RepID=UPI00119BC948|nr:zinc ribbon domain-containing protein [Variovorax paradoxus]MDR6517492.1 hypothetical protein [Variovorax paradoxus]
MALKPCRECKKEVSTEAKACPHCGVTSPTKKPPSTKEALIGAGAIIAVVAIGIAMSGETDAEKSAAAEKQAAEKAACMKDLACHGNNGIVAAGIYCAKHVEKLAKNSSKWTDGTLEPKFSHFRWNSEKEGSITFIGDKAQFQNSFGAYVNVVYECDLNGAQDQVLDVRVREGRM